MGMNELHIGKVIDDRYELLAQLGEGGVGCVFKAKDLELTRDVAIKFLLTEEGSSKFRLQREASVLANLCHPNLITVYGLELQAKPPYIVMEYEEALSLADRLSKEVKLGLDEARRLFLSMAKALAYLHSAEVIHRDVKPANILSLPDGTFKLADFGLALPANITRLTEEGFTVGTLAYLPPEVLKGEDYSAASDVYQLGLVLFEALTSERYNPSYGPSELLKIPDEFEPLLKECLQIEVGKRPQTGSALFDLLSPPQIDEEKPREGFSLIGLVFLLIIIGLLIRPSNRTPEVTGENNEDLKVTKEQVYTFFDGTMFKLILKKPREGLKVDFHPRGGRSRRKSIDEERGTAFFSGMRYQLGSRALWTIKKDGLTLCQDEAIARRHMYASSVKPWIKKRAEEKEWPIRTAHISTQIKWWKNYMLFIDRSCRLRCYQYFPEKNKENLVSRFVFDFHPSGSPPLGHGSLGRAFAVNDGRAYFVAYCSRNQGKYKYYLFCVPIEGQGEEEWSMPIDALIGPTTESVIKDGRLLIVCMLHNKPLSIISFSLAEKNYYQDLVHKGIKGGIGISNLCPILLGNELIIPIYKATHDNYAVNYTGLAFRRKNEREWDCFELKDELLPERPYVDNERKHMWLATQKELLLFREKSREPERFPFSKRICSTPLRVGDDYYLILGAEHSLYRWSMGQEAKRLSGSLYRLTTNTRPDVARLIGRDSFIVGSFYDGLFGYSLLSGGHNNLLAKDYSYGNLDAFVMSTTDMIIAHNYFLQATIADHGIVITVDRMGNVIEFPREFVFGKKKTPLPR